MIVVERERERGAGTGTRAKNGAGVWQFNLKHG